MHAAYQLSPREAMAKLKEQAQWLKNQYPDAGRLAARGPGGNLHRQPVGTHPALMRCLATSNIIENPNGIVRATARRVKRYRDADMVLRWTAAGFLQAQKSFRKIQGIKDLWALKAALGRTVNADGVDRQVLAA